MKPSTNLAARMGRWSARNRKTAIFGWLAFVVAAVVIGGVIGTKQLGDNDTLPGESGPCPRILDEAFDQPAGETVLVTRRSPPTARLRAAVEDVARRVSASRSSPTSSPCRGQRRARSRPTGTPRS